MIIVAACPRCKGAVLDYRAPFVESRLCINCGWREHVTPPDPLKSVRSELARGRLTTANASKKARKRHEATGSRRESKRGRTKVAR